MKLIIVESKGKIGQIVGDILLNAVHQNPKTVFGLATGSSPEGTYQYLIEDYRTNKTDWSQVVTFNLDEYVGLESNHVQSYRHFMNEKLFDHLNINKDNTYVPTGTGDYQMGAKEYDDIIKKAGGIDVQLLGLGTNGHIGFNEPPVDFNSLTHVVDLVESTIKDNARFFNSVQEVPKQAVSMGIKSILNAKKIILVAYGVNKAEAVKHLVEGKLDNLWPCSALQIHHDLTIVIDKTAGSLLQNNKITNN